MPDVLHCKAVYRDKRLGVAVVPKSSAHSLTASTSNRAVSSDAIVQQSNLIAAVTDFIKDHLPSHYWPDVVFPVEVLPMTKHGKCDTDALWEAAIFLPQVKFYDEDLKDTLSNMWKEATGRKDSLNQDDVFIHSGGNSFQALQLANRIQAFINIQLPWLLDDILQKSFSVVLQSLQNVHGDNQVCLKHNHTEIGDSKIELHIAKKRKHDDVENSPATLNQFSNAEFSEIDKSKNSASIKCMMTSVSRCNRCFDWFINIDDTVSDFKFWGSNLNEWKQHFINTALNFDKCLGGDVINTCKFIENDRNVSEFDWKKKISKFEIVERWRYDTGKCVDASPLIASLRDGRMVVYIGSHSHRFSAILLDTGQLLWETTLGDRIESSACITMDGRFVVVGCYDYNLYAFDSLTGDIWMKYKVGGEVKSSPVVDPVTSLVIFGSHDHCIHAVDVETKTAIWCTYVDAGSIFASPCIAMKPHVIFCATLGGVVASLNGDTGAVLWKYRCPKPVFSSPMLTSEGICFGCVDGGMYHLNFLGDIIWTYKTEAPIFSSPAIVDNYIYIGSHDCHMYCLSCDGDLVWKVKVPSPIYSSGFSFTLDRFKSTCDHKMETIDGGNTLLQSSSTVIFNNDEIIDVLNVQSSKIIQKDILKFDLSENSINDLPSCFERENIINLHQKAYILDKKSRFLIFASTDGLLFSVNSYTGEIICQYKLQGEVFSSPVVYQNHIIIGCRNDFVYSLEMNKTE